MKDICASESGKKKGSDGSKMMKLNRLGQVCSPNVERQRRKYSVLCLCVRRISALSLAICFPGGPRGVSPASQGGPDSAGIWRTGPRWPVGLLSAAAVTSRLRCSLPRRFLFFFCACVVLSLRIYSAVVTPFSLCHFPSCFLLPCSALILFQPVSVSTAPSAPLRVTLPSIFSLFIRRLSHGLGRLPAGSCLPRLSHVVGKSGKKGHARPTGPTPVGFTVKLVGQRCSQGSSARGGLIMCSWCLLTACRSAELVFIPLVH